MAERVRVNLGYDIIIGERILAEAGRHIAPFVKGGVVIVSDETVARLYLHRLTNALEEQKISSRAVIIPPGEGSKSWEIFGETIEHILEQQPDRQTVLIALGGGVVGDVTGFAASVLLRGVPFVQIPTTLLSQVDSAVGGKTGINAKAGKNLIGSFHQPKLVLSDVSLLATLPKRQWLAGYAEMLKYGLIRDAAFFAWLEKNGAALLSDMALISEAIRQSCAAKAAIVERDEKESGERALLNFGHTFAHALEAETGFSDTLLHGEAVAIGMILAMKLSLKLGILKNDAPARVRAHYKAMGLPALPREIRHDWDAEKIMSHFARDKKAKNGQLTFIVSRGIGQAEIANNVDKSIVQQTLVEALAGV